MKEIDIQQCLLIETEIWLVTDEEMGQKLKTRLGWGSGEKKMVAVFHTVMIVQVEQVLASCVSFLRKLKLGCLFRAVCGGSL